MRNLILAVVRDGHGRSGHLRAADRFAPRPSGAIMTATAIITARPGATVDGRYRCRRSNGTTGLIIGAAGGALVGRELDGGRNRATGTILGAAAGALIGREVQRGSSRRRCR